MNGDIMKDIGKKYTDDFTKVFFSNIMQMVLANKTSEEIGEYCKKQVEEFSYKIVTLEYIL